MELTTGYILLLAKQPHTVHKLASLLRHTNYSVTIAHSEDEAMVQAAQRPPFLIILAGDYHHWSQTSLRELRDHANLYHITLISLTDAYSASWIHQEENPGFDGFLVNPLSSEILSSLVQSAHTRQAVA